MIVQLAMAGRLPSTEDLQGAVLAALWVELAWDGRHADAPFTVPDGRQFDEVIGAGEFASLAEHVWLSVSNSGRAGDVLWTTSMAFTVVSTRNHDWNPPCDAHPAGEEGGGEAGDVGHLLPHPR